MTCSEKLTIPDGVQHYPHHTAQHVANPMHPLPDTFEGFKDFYLISKAMIWPVLDVPSFLA